MRKIRILISIAMLGLIPSVMFSEEVISSKISNPIKAKNINDFFLSIISICIQIGTIVAGLAIIYGGLLYVTAQGDEEKISKAHKTLTWALVGTAILLGARVILEAIKATVGAL